MDPAKENRPKFTFGSRRTDRLAEAGVLKCAGIARWGAGMGMPILFPLELLLGLGMAEDDREKDACVPVGFFFKDDVGPAKAVDDDRWGFRPESKMIHIVNAACSYMQFSYPSLC